MSFRHADAIKKYVNNARLGKVDLGKRLRKKRFWGKNMLEKPGLEEIDLEKRF